MKKKLAVIVFFFFFLNSCNTSKNVVIDNNDSINSQETPSMAGDFVEQESSTIEGENVNSDVIKEIGFRNQEGESLKLFSSEKEIKSILGEPSEENDIENLFDNNKVYKRSVYVKENTYIIIYEDDIAIGLDICPTNKENDINGFFYEIPMETNDVFPIDLSFNPDSNDFGFAFWSYDGNNFTKIDELTSGYHDDEVALYYYFSNTEVTLGTESGRMLIG